MATLDELIARGATPNQLAADAYIQGFADGLVAGLAPEPVERLVCLECGKAVSTDVPAATIVHAAVICPECLERLEP